MQASRHLVVKLAKGLLGIGGLLLIGVNVGGCYHRVVGARGLGADQVEIEEPYQQDTKLDDWVYGPPKPTDNRPKVQDRPLNPNP